MGRHPDGLSSERQMQGRRMRKTGRKGRGEAWRNQKRTTRRSGRMETSKDSAGRAADLGTRQENADPRSVA